MTNIDLGYIEELYSQPKELHESVEWQQEEGPGRKFSMRTEVRGVETGEKLILGGETWNIDKYSFFLRYGGFMIRVFDFNHHHVEKGIYGAHKHKYKEMAGYDQEVYDVGDVCTSDLLQGLIDFLDECNIDQNNQPISGVPSLGNYE